MNTQSKGLLEDVGLLKFGHTVNLVGAVYLDSETNKRYELLFPGEEPGESMLQATATLTTDEWDKLFQQLDTLGVEVFEKDENGKLIKVIVRKSQRQIAQEVMWEVFRRDEYACRYCGNAKTPMTTDHLVLWEEGGPSTFANMVASCKKCNRSRGNMQYADWLRSPYYKKVSVNLTPEQRAANDAIVGTLDSIPRTINQRSKRS